MVTFLGMYSSRPVSGAWPRKVKTNKGSVLFLGHYTIFEPLLLHNS